MMDELINDLLNRIAGLESEIEALNDRLRQLKVLYDKKDELYTHTAWKLMQYEKKDSCPAVKKA